MRELDIKATRSSMLKGFPTFNLTHSLSLPVNVTLDPLYLSCSSFGKTSADNTTSNIHLSWSVICRIRE
ncbi:hypothetical protein QVD17_00978 [Tagetes erecta]|uniref:Uncharacterized protein n=1 Tax=Tagetes erecta TaxID=13708 RepID=A0AAD8L5J7_TARER|nr:hypothetical protein QVD17_00978 [Tagetes erecta]